ncbi:MAG: aldehyde ferredoxin oxidoreductase family protein [Anaerolineales bacterium]|jgi:aldehyde:ferredoxin oxidoreductase|nr:aldehyde ferredoxin oxidoreductase family protein [Anaerolineales bacterium]
MQPILKIDLSSGKIETLIIPPDFERDYLGGASLGARLLWDSLTRQLNPLSAASPLLILNGPLSGTAGPTVGRFVVCGKSPATGLWAESNCGGFFGPELRMAGWDGIWITGQAETPVYLSIQDSQVEMRPAGSLWGKDTYEIQEAIKHETGISGTRILGIGVAGEQLLPFALLLCDHGRVAGRTGLGAVMGSKNLKAIAVKGTGKVPVLDGEAYAPRRAAANRALKADPMTSVLSSLGSAGAADYFDYLGEQPKKYFSAGTLENADQISGASVAETILAGKSACHACVIACGRVVRLEDGQKRKGPEYETLVGFGPNLGLTSPASATRLGELCDRYGMDSISTSGVIGLAFRLWELGFIGEQDTGGLRLAWGNAEAAEQLIHLTVRREGLGQFLALGTKKMAEHFGAPDEAIQVNGLEVAYHDPRGASGMAIVYATSPRGACHNQSDYFLADIGQVDSSLGMDFYDRHAGAEKAANVAKHQDFRTVNNALVLCIFANVPPETMLDLVNRACGYDLTLADFLQTGERAWNLKRLINLKLGLTRANDSLPKPLLRAYQEGGAAGYVIPFDEMMAAYYAARGWDAVTGRPNLTKLSELGLAWVEKA